MQARVEPPNALCHPVKCYIITSIVGESGMPEVPMTHPCRGAAIDPQEVDTMPTEVPSHLSVTGGAVG